MKITGQPLRCLIVEDMEDDAHLLLRELRASGYDVTSERVDTPETMRAALERTPWDLVISDFSMPGFSGLDALKLLQASGRDLPFIMVTGAMGEDTAVATMQAGAHDYILKDKLARLRPAVARELTHAADRRARRLAEEATRRNESLLAAAGHLANLGGWRVNLAEGQVVWSEQVALIHEEPPGFSPTLAQGINYYAPEWREKITAVFTACARDGTPYDEEMEIITARGRRVWVRTTGEAVRDAEGRIHRVQGALQNISARKQAEAIDAFLAQAGVSMEGESFFPALARFLAKTLQMDYVRIGRLDGDGLDVTTLVVWRDGRFEDNRTYALQDTPCGQVIEKKVCCYPAEVIHSFPNNATLQELQAESCVGVPLFSHTGQPIGLIAVIGRQPLANRELVETTLARVTPRAAGELERLLVEAELKTSEERYRTLFSSMLEGFCLFEVLFDDHGRPNDLRFLEINSAFEAQCGLRDVVGKRIREVLPRFEDSWYQIYGKVVLTGEPAQFENEAKELNRWFSVSSYRVGEPARRQVGVIFHDITARKQAEAALRESEEKFKALADGSPLAIYMSTGIEQNATYINPTFLQLFGYSFEEVSSFAKWAPLAYPDETYRRQISEDWHQCIAQAIATGGEVVPKEAVVVCKDGSRKTILWGFKTAGKENWAFGLDLTARKQAEMALAAREEIFSNIVGQANDAIALVDAETGRLVEFNRAAHEGLGYTREEFAGFRISDIQAEKSQAQVAQDIRQIQTAGSLTFETRHRNRSGEIREVRISARPMKLRGRDYLTCVWSDITEAKQAEESLRQQAEEIRLRNESLSRFNAVAVGRELRMIELKREINELCDRVGEPPRHRIPAVEATTAKEPSP